MKRIGLILILIILVVFGLHMWSERNENTGNLPQAATTTIPVYRSNALDVSFYFNPVDTGILEQNNKVYIYASGTQPLEGQWIERFQKSVSETFQQSIERQILAGFSTSTCTVQVSSSTNYLRAEIAYPEPKDPNASFFENQSKCNEAYDKTNGIRYFLYDANHPDRFYFLNIGQYPIIATGTQTWQDTLRIGN